MMEVQHKNTHMVPNVEKVLDHVDLGMIEA